MRINEDADTIKTVPDRMKKNMAMHQWTIGVLLIGQMELLADYTVVFETENARNEGGGLETVFSYKDDDHTRLDRRTPEGRLQDSILVSGGRTYLITYDRGGPAVADLDDIRQSGRQPERAEEADGIAQKTVVGWSSTGRTKSIAGIEGEVWEATSAEGNETHTSEAVLTEAKAVREAFEAYADLLRRLGEERASNLPVFQGEYTVIEYSETMRLTRFDTEKIDDETFALPDGVPAPKMSFATLFGGGKAKDEHPRGDVDKACYVQVCCGHVRGKADALARMAAASAEGYALAETATCDFLGIGALFGVNSVEGALYQKGLDAVTVTLDMNAKDLGAVRRSAKSSLKGRTSEVEDYQEGRIKDYVYYYVILKPDNVQTLDVVIDEHTVVSFSHLRSGTELPMVQFAEAAIDFGAYKSKRNCNGTVRKICMIIIVPNRRAARWTAPSND